MLPGAAVRGDYVPGNAVAGGPVVRSRLCGEVRRGWGGSTWVDVAGGGGGGERGWEGA